MHKYGQPVPSTNLNSIYDLRYLERADCAPARRGSGAVVPPVFHASVFDLRYLDRPHVEDAARTTTAVTCRARAPRDDDRARCGRAADAAAAAAAPLAAGRRPSLVRRLRARMQSSVAQAARSKWRADVLRVYGALLRAAALRPGRARAPRI